MGRRGEQGVRAILWPLGRNRRARAPADGKAMTSATGSARRRSNDASTPIEPDLFRALLRRQAASVGVVTAAATPPVGFTATSFTSVSARPPLVSFNLDRASSSWPAVSAAGHVGVNILSQGQENVARRFATSGIDRFGDGLSW